jgi:hypothetical protein
MTRPGRHARSQCLLDLLAQVPGPLKRHGCPAWVEFTGAAQVVLLRRTVTRRGKKTVEVAYLVTSDCGGGPGLPWWASV